MYIYTCTIYTYTVYNIKSIYTHKYIYNCTYIFICIRIYIHGIPCVYTHVPCTTCRAYIYIYTSISVYIHIYTYIYIHMYIYIHTRYTLYIYIHIHRVQHEERKRRLHQQLYPKDRSLRRPCSNISREIRGPKCDVSARLVLVYDALQRLAVYICGE